MAKYSRRRDRSRALAILVVEDNRELRDQIAAQLRHHGCRVVSAASGAEGLEAVVLDRFDAVVTDVEMLPRGALWLWREITLLRPALRGRFVFLSRESWAAPAAEPFREGHVLKPPLGSERLWAEILAVTAPERSRTPRTS